MCICHCYMLWSASTFSSSSRWHHIDTHAKKCIPTDVISFIPPLFSPLDRLSTTFNLLLHITLLRTNSIIEWLLIKTKVLSIFVPLFRIRESAHCLWRVSSGWCFHRHLYKRAGRVLFYSKLNSSVIDLLQETTSFCFKIPMDVPIIIIWCTLLP